MWTQLLAGSTVARGFGKFAKNFSDGVTPTPRWIAVMCVQGEGQLVR